MADETTFVVNTVTLSNTFDLSREGLLKFGCATDKADKSGYNWTTTGLKTLRGFKSGTLSFEGNSIDNSTRDEQGWSTDNTGTRSASLEITFNKISADTVSIEGVDTDNDAQKFIRQLILDGTWGETGVGIVYQSNSGTGTGNAFAGIFVLTNYSENSSYDGTAVECSASFKSFGEIYTDATVPNGWDTDGNVIEEVKKPDDGGYVGPAEAAPIDSED